MKLKCIIIDDELHAINGLRKYIETLPDLNLVHVYTDPIQALSEISGGTPVDIIFMDVDMPLITGLELSRAIRHKTDKLIFTTSHSRHAYEAFEIDANAYLLKPYSFARFVETIMRLFPKASIKPSIPSEKEEEDYFFVKNKDDGNSLTKLYYKDVIAVEGLQNYIRIYVHGNNPIIAYVTLSEIKIVMLKQPIFMQTHRSFIISKAYIDKLEGNFFTMSNKVTVPIGNSYKEDVQKYLKEKTIKTGRA